MAQALLDEVVHVIGHAEPTTPDESAHYGVELVKGDSVGHQAHVQWTSRSTFGSHILDDVDDDVKKQFDVLGLDVIAGLDLEGFVYCHVVRSIPRYRGRVRQRRRSGKCC